MSKLLAGLSIALAATAGVYAMASTVTTAATVTTAEANAHSDVVAFVAALKWAAAAHRSANANCEILARTERAICDAAARSERRRARAGARSNVYANANGYATAAVRDDDAMSDIVPDVALYRAHRQLPDVQLGCYATDDTNVRRKRFSPKKNWSQIAMQ